MKNTRRILAALLALCMLTAASAFAQADIGREAAEAAAFADAGVIRENVQFLKTETDTEHNQLVYEVEFEYGGLEYEYWVSASNGSMVRRSWEPTASRALELYLNQARDSAAIGEDAARQSALSVAGLNETDVRFAATWLDEEDGLRVYEVSFFTADTEYEYQIDAFSGAVYSMSMEQFLAEESVRPGDRLPTGGLDEGSGRIGREAAKAKALSDAGLSAADVTFIKAKLDREDGIEVYEIEFVTDSTEYEYEINAATGKVYSRSMETRGRQDSATTGGTGNIDVEQAKSIALKHASLSASDVTFTKAKLDWDDGVAVYEIEFNTASAEYEYEINAATGKIFSRSVESFSMPANPSTGSTASYIGVDRAKSIAVKHAGLSVSDVTFTKAKLENDHGQKQYEIEFRRNGVEYEYSIHATTGNILDYDVERDDDDDERCDYCGKSGHDDDDCPSRPAHHDDDDERCDYCGKSGHDDDDCPSRPAHHDDDDDERCDYCGKSGHDDDDCPSRPAHHNDDDDERCDYCGKSGHDDDDCPSRPTHHDDDDD